MASKIIANDKCPDVRPIIDKEECNSRILPKILILALGEDVQPLVADQLYAD